MKMKITKRQLRRIIKEAVDCDSLPLEAGDTHWNGYRKGEDRARRYNEPVLEAKMPSRSRMKELKDAAWAKVSERFAYLLRDVRSVRIVPHQNLKNASERVEPEFEDQMMMRVYVKDRNGRNPVFDVVMNLASGRAEGATKVR